MSSKPIRIQLRRTKGWRMPPNTVKVDRATAFGNPFIKANDSGPDWRTQSVRQFERWLQGTRAGRALVQRARLELAGKNLACWCPLDGPCHAEVLLRCLSDSERTK